MTGKNRKTNDATMKKYLYYRELGYCEETAELLSALTYGDEPLSALMKELGTEHGLKKLGAWLAERPEGDPEQAVRNWYYGRQRQEPWESGIRYGSAAGFSGGMANCAPTAPARAPKGKAGRSMSLGSGIRNSVSRLAPRAKRASVPTAGTDTDMRFCVLEEPDPDAEMCLKPWTYAATSGSRRHWPPTAVNRLRRRARGRFCTRRPPPSA